MDSLHTLSLVTSLRPVRLPEGMLSYLAAPERGYGFRLSKMLISLLG